MNTIAKMKDDVARLDEFADLEEIGNDEGDEVESADGRQIKIKPVKTQMCKKLLLTGKCNGLKDKTCNFAHNAIELSLIPVSSKIKNLNTVIIA